MLTRSGRSAKRCAARKSISRRLSSGPPVWRKLATRHDSRRSPLATTSSACDSTPTSFANRTPATHTFSEEGAAWFGRAEGDRKSTRLNSSHGYISYAVFCLKKKKKYTDRLDCDYSWSTSIIRQL